MSHILIKVKIYYYEVFQKGTLTLTLEDGATVKDALKKLIIDFGEEFRKKTGSSLEQSFETTFNVFLNGTHITLPSAFNHQLTDRDELLLLRPVRGG